MKPTLIRFGEELEVILSGRARRGRSFRISALCARATGRRSSSSGSMDWQSKACRIRIGMRGPSGRSSAATRNGSQSKRWGTIQKLCITPIRSTRKSPCRVWTIGRSSGSRTRSASRSRNCCRFSVGASRTASQRDRVGAGLNRAVKESGGPARKNGQTGLHGGRFGERDAERLRPTPTSR